MNFVFKAVLISLADASGVAVSGHVKCINAILVSPLGTLPVVNQNFQEICGVTAQQMDKLKFNFQKATTEKAQRKLIQKTLRNYTSVSLFFFVPFVLLLIVNCPFKKKNTLDGVRTKAHTIRNFYDKVFKNKIMATPVPAVGDDELNFDRLLQ